MTIGELKMESDGTLYVNTGSTWSAIAQPRYAHQSQVDMMASDLSEIKERLAILEPSMHLHEEFPALKAAYENYKVIERMVKGG